MSQNEFLDLNHGFLPLIDPLEKLSPGFEPWEEVSLHIPKLLVANRVQASIKSLPLLNVESLTTQQELERAMLLLSFMGHAYVWGDPVPEDKIPASLAVPWFEVATKLNRFPILSYASYALHNWRRVDKAGPIELGNIVLLQNFLGGLDEEWFVLVHIDIEMKAAPALQRFEQIQQAVATENLEELTFHLDQVIDSLEHMCTTLDRMTEHCDPYIYYTRVRPYIHGWKDNPALPKGILYGGVTSYQNTPQQFRGETGAQSTIIPAFDALLGVQHREDPLRFYLAEMRHYMPLAHRRFLEEIEAKGSIRDFVVQYVRSNSTLRDQYNTSLNLLSRFRQTHLRFAAHFIQKQSQSSLANPTDTGTGGTLFMSYLKKHKDETLLFLV